MSAQGQKLYKISEVAALLRLSESQVYTLIACNDLGCYRFTTGKQGGIRVSEAQISEFLRQSEQPPAESDPAPFGHIR